MRLTLAAITVIALGGVAHAGPDPFEQVVADIAAGKNVDHWFTDCDVLVAPGGQVRHPCSITRADLVADAKATLKVTANKVASLYQSQYEYRDATVVAKVGSKVVATYRVIEVSGMGNPDGPDGGWGVRAAHWIKVIKDKDATALALAGNLPAPPAIAAATAPSKSTGDQDRSDDASLIEDVKQAIDGNTDVKASLVDWLTSGAILIGSAPGQKWTGKKGAKVVKAWKLALAQDGGVDLAAGGMVGFAATHVTGTTTVKGKTAAVTYAALVVYTQGLTQAGSLISGPRLISFSVPH